jgi:hypothetical protein
MPPWQKSSKRKAMQRGSSEKTNEVRWSMSRIGSLNLIAAKKISEAFLNGVVATQVAYARRTKDCNFETE